VTAACIVRLFRDLKLNLDSACGAYISVPYLNPAITIRQLLNCTSGLGEYEDLLFGPSYRGDTAFSPQELIKLAALRGPHFPPGERFEYSNVTFVALALVIESLTGLTYEKVVRQQILQPLGIDMWFASREALPRARMIEAYWLPETGGERHCADLDHSAALATGDAACTVATALRFWSSLNDPENATGVSLATLSESTVLAPRVVVKPTSLGVEYGLGVEVRRWAGDRVVGHPGTIHGARSGSWADHEKQLTVTVYVTNTAIASEDARITSQRFQGHALFSSALHTAYALWDLEQRAA
jgi:D-alanyl-D-alanine carboxypeptidase